MATLLVNQVVEIKVFCSQQNQVALNVSHWTVTIPTGVGVQKSDFMTALVNTLAPLYYPLLNNSARFRGLTARILDQPTPDTEDTTGGPNSPGTAGADPMPKQCCGLFKITTFAAGRKFRGRKYIPFPAQQDNLSPDDMPRNNYLTNLDALATAYVASLTVAGGGASVVMRPTIYHRATHSGSFVNSYVLRSVWANQRRRGDTGRPNAMPF